MTKADLAAELKKRQKQMGLVPSALIDGLGEDEIIDCYNTCSCCDGKTFSPEQLDATIHQAKTTDDWLALLKEANHAQVER